MFGELRFPEYTFDRQRATGHVGRVLQDAHISGHQGRGGKTKHLPEGEIPGHYCQNHPQRLKGDKAVAGIGLDLFPAQKLLRIFRIVLTNPGAFLGFGASVFNRFAHLFGHQVGIAIGIFAEQQGCSSHQIGSFGKRHMTPFQKGAM